MAKKIRIKAAGVDQVIQQDELMEAHAQVQEAIMNLVWSNEDLREELALNPKEVLERELGIKFSKSISVNMINQKDTKTVTYLIPLPVKEVVKVIKKADTDNVISDEDLKEVAGGAGTDFQVVWVKDSAAFKSAPPITIASNPTVSINKGKLIAAAAVGAALGMIPIAGQIAQNAAKQAIQKSVANAVSSSREIIVPNYHSGGLSSLF